MTRKIIITGSASGIGAALAIQMRGDGWNVVGLDRAMGPHVQQVCDLADSQAIAEAAAVITGPIHAVAHVAGVPGTAAPEAILAVNTLAPMALTNALTPKLADDGAVIAVSSVTALRCPLDDAAMDGLLALDRETFLARHAALDGKAAYEQSKALLNRWCLRQAHVLSPRSIRVNTVSPGPVETPILTDFRASIGEDRIAAAEKLTGRHAQPGEIASVIAFLASDAGRWVNGTDVRADGGYHALRTMAEAV